ncbi:MAG: hypothetical protein NC319_02935 [Butyricicoccus sp.]|nr:hypothetical protein [Butyricicoccus sp.]MCM1236165.1 hypothetical protein [Ruminococcus flavefaciens]
MKYNNRISDVRPESGDAPVTLKICGNVLEICHALSTAGSPVRKIDAEHGVDVRTGEVIDYKHKETRAENIRAVSQSMKRLRDIINTNLTRPSHALWVTLTYKENMTDTKRLYEEYRRFWCRFGYYLKKHSYPHAEYITAVEPQARGAWHLHCLFLFPKKAPFIPNDDIAKIWGHGFCKTKSLKGIANPGLYLTAYLTDMEFTEALSEHITKGRLAEAEVTDENGVKQKKAIIKGARLKLYPTGFKLYRCSRGVKRPETYKTTEAEAQKIVGTAPLTFEKTVSITDSNGKVVNVVNYRTYTRQTKKRGR